MKPGMHQKIYAVGIGPGAQGHVTPQAMEALRTATVIMGYRPYGERVQPWVGAKRLVLSGMRAEVERCNSAIDEALRGEIPAVVSSGDAGVYGMAGLLLELLQERNLPNVEVIVVPGITAATAAAAALGAPLMNDFAVISLSDLMTPRDTILLRLNQVAGADLACVLYNPRSTKRKELFESALGVFKVARGPELACGWVRNAGTPELHVWVGRLADLLVGEIDMSTVVIIGCSQTRIWNGRLVTVRGYRDISALNTRNGYVP